MGVQDYRIIIMERSNLISKNPYDVRGNKIYLHGDIYRNLGSLTKNTRIQEDGTPNSIFDNFMRDMNSLYDDTQEYQPSDADKIKLAIIDEYIGSLGMDIEYPKDRQKHNMRCSIIADGEYISPFN